MALALQRFLDHVDPKLPLHVDLDASSNHLGDLPTAQLLWTLRGPDATIGPDIGR